MGGADVLVVLAGVATARSGTEHDRSHLSTPRHAPYKLTQALKPQERLLVSSEELRRFQEANRYSALEGSRWRQMRRWECLSADRQRAILRAVEGRELTVSEICAELGCRAEQVAVARQMLGRDGRSVDELTDRVVKGKPKINPEARKRAWAFGDDS